MSIWPKPADILRIKGLKRFVSIDRTEFNVGIKSDIGDICEV